MTVFLDACAIIYWIEGIEPWRQRVQDQIRSALGSSGGSIAISEISLLECTVKPLQDRNAERLARFDQFFGQPELISVALDRAVISRAAQVRAFSKLKTPDALQAASALSLEAEVLFLTNDRRFDRVPGLTTKVL